MALNKDKSSQESSSQLRKIVMTNHNQKGNPLLQFISHVTIQFVPSLTVDYLVGPMAGVVFLSLKYHQLYPDYIHERVRSIRNQEGAFSLLVLLCLVDIHTEGYVGYLRELTRLTSLYQHWTLILAWRPLDAARYIETLKMYENKTPEIIMEKRLKEDAISQAIAFLTCIPSIHATDAMNLLAHFRSIKNICDASEEELLSIPGLGPTKRHSRMPFNKACFVRPLNALIMLANKSQSPELVQCTGIVLLCDGEARFCSDFECIWFPKCPKFRCEPSSLYTELFSNISSRLSYYLQGHEDEEEEFNTGDRWYPFPDSSSMLSNQWDTLRFYRPQLTDSPDDGDDDNDDSGDYDGSGYERRKNNADKRKQESIYSHLNQLREHVGVSRDSINLTLFSSHRQNITNTSTYEDFVSYWNARLVDIVYCYVREHAWLAWSLDSYLILPLLFLGGFIIRSYYGYTSPSVDHRCKDAPIQPFVFTMGIDSIFADRMLSKRLSNFVNYYFQYFMSLIKPSSVEYPSLSHMMGEIELFAHVILKRTLGHFIREDNQLKMAKAVLIRNRPPSEDQQQKTLKQRIIAVAKNYLSAFPKRVVIPFGMALVGLSVQHALIQLGLSYYPSNFTYEGYLQLTSPDLVPSTPAIFYSFICKKLMSNVYYFISSYWYAREVWWGVYLFSACVYVLIRWGVEIVKEITSEDENMTSVGRYLYTFSMVYVLAYALNYLLYLKAHYYDYFIRLLRFSYVPLSAFIPVIIICGRSGRVLMTFFSTILKFSIGDFHHIVKVFIKSWDAIFVSLNHSKESVTSHALMALSESSIYLLLQSAAALKLYMTDEVVMSTRCSYYENHDKCAFAFTVAQSPVFNATGNSSEHGGGGFFEVKQELLTQQCSSTCQNVSSAQDSSEPPIYETLKRQFFSYIFRKSSDRRWLDLSIADYLFYAIRRFDQVRVFFERHLPLPVLYFLIYTWQSIQEEQKSEQEKLSSLSRPPLFLPIRPDIYICRYNIPLYHVIVSIFVPLLVLIAGYLAQHLVLQIILFYDRKKLELDGITFSSFPSLNFAGSLFNSIVPFDELLVNMISIILVELAFTKPPRSPGHSFGMYLSWQLGYYVCRRFCRFVLYNLYPSGNSRVVFLSVLTLLVQLPQLKSWLQKWTQLMLEKVLLHWALIFTATIAVLAILIPLMAFGKLFTFSEAVKFLWNIFSMDIKYGATVTLVMSRSIFLPTFLQNVYFPFPDILDGLTLLLVKLFDVATQRPIYWHYAKPS